MHRLALVLLLAASGCAEDPFDTGRHAEPVRVCPDGPTVEGIDVSKWQGTIDWDDVAASWVRYAIIRVNHGLDDIDEKFAENWAEARRVGITRGAYQYFLPGEDAHAQAQLLLDLMGPLEDGDLPPVLDVEEADGDGPSDIVNDIHVWMEHVEASLGMTPFIYTAKYFWQDGVGMPADFLDHPLWVANYNVECPLIADPWTRWEFWQYTSTGSIPGISGNVDRDFFNGTEDDLLRLTKGGGVCGDAACTGGESHATCAADCAGCEPITTAGAILDEDGPCFTPGGSPTSWRWEPGGWDGNLRWTYAWEASTADNHGVWNLAFEQSCTYRLEAHTPVAWAESRQAPYRIRHDGEEVVTVVDQTATDGWSVLGEYRFAAGGDQWIRLGDNTGEPLTENRRLVFDAIRLTRVEGIECDDDAGGGGYGVPGDMPSIPVTDLQAEQAPAANAGGCATTPGGNGAPTVLWLLVAALLRPRKRRR